MLRKLAAFAILASSITFLAFTLSQDSSGNRDFVAYWSAAQLLKNHQNPYDPQETLRLEQSAGWHRSEPMMMLTPPFCLPLIAPLSRVGARSGAVLWTLLIVGCLMGSVRLLWKLHGQPDNRLHLLSYFFAPLILCVFAGQAVAFVLTGLVLFLWFQASRPFVAGLCLALAVTLKPHLFIAFGMALLFWVVARRRFAILGGVIAGVAALALAATIIDPHSWREYMTTMQASHVENRILPNLSLLFRIAVNQNLVWLQLVPAAAASCWALWYAHRHQADWDWLSHGSLLMIVSVLVAPYSWFFDEITLLPAVLHGVYMAYRNGRSLGWLGACAAAALIMVFCSVPINVFYFTWTPLAWLATYAYEVRPPSHLPVGSPAPHQAV